MERSNARVIQVRELTEMKGRCIQPGEKAHILRIRAWEGLEHLQVFADTAQWQTQRLKKKHNKNSENASAKWSIVCVFLNFYYLPWQNLNKIYPHLPWQNWKWKCTHRTPPGLPICRGSSCNTVSNRGAQTVAPTTADTPYIVNNHDHCSTCSTTLWHIATQPDNSTAHKGLWI